MKSPALLASALLSLAALISGCHSLRIDATVENRTGAEIRLLEVEYPSATFGADKLAPGEILPYRMALRGNGPIKVQYTTPGNTIVQMDGPQLVDNQEGSLQIVLLPDGKAEFHPQLTPAH